MSRSSTACVASPTCSWQGNELGQAAAATIIIGNRLQRTPEWQGAVGLNIDKPVTRRST